MDIISVERRSSLMARIRSKNTGPEMIVRRLAHALGYRYLLHDRRLPGSPDLVFPGRKKVVLVHGCFWHGHDCGRGFRPKTNADFWSAKIERNKDRDLRQQRALRRLGWRTLVIWECATRADRVTSLERRLVRFLGS
jgi:DNA mismatch endonuclease (patch repair protein)